MFILADVKRLAKIIDPEISDQFIRVAFVVGLPESVKKQLKANLAGDDLSISDLVEIARRVVVAGGSVVKKVVCHVWL